MLIILKSPSNQREEGVPYCTGHMGNPSLKYVFNLPYLILGASCLMPSSLCTPRKDGKAAEGSQGSFMKKFSKTAHGNSM